MTAANDSEPTRAELDVEIQALVARIKASFGDYYDASVYPNGTGVFVSILAEDSWTHEWEVTRVSGRSTWEIKHTLSYTGYYDSTDELINQIGEALPDADEDDTDEQDG